MNACKCNPVTICTSGWAKVLSGEPVSFNCNAHSMNVHIIGSFQVLFKLLILLYNLCNGSYFAKQTSTNYSCI